MKDKYTVIRNITFLIQIVLCFLCVNINIAAQEAPFQHGVNLTNWFQASGPGRLHYNKYGREDFENIKSLGFDVVRLPINLHFMTSGDPDYLVDTIFLEYLGEVISWAEELELYLILDNHTSDINEDTDPGVGDILNKVWGQMAMAFKDRSEYLCYEVLNEPHGITDALWNSIQQGVIESIRQSDTTHYIVVGPTEWNSVNNLEAMQAYEDDKLIYTFHFYDPFLFTHQGASWINPSMAGIENVPFPYDAAQMPSLPEELVGTWLEDLFDNYPEDGTVENIREQIDIAVHFRDQRGVPLFCGELGVLQPNSMQEHRIAWYNAVRTFLDSMHIAWTMWDYHGSFGLFEEDGEGMFEYDLNIPLLEALDLNIPEQSAYERQPDSTIFMMYDDYMARTIWESSYSDGILNFISTEFPNNGDFCIHWTGASQYSWIVFDLSPNRDLSRLKNEGYALDMMVRGDDPDISFDVRFFDSKTSDDQDLPWRIRVTVDDQLAEFDGQWHHLHIPLSNFSEMGAWYNDTYYPSQNAFDWSDVDLFVIALEAQALASSKLWFDNIMLTNLDTAQAVSNIWREGPQPISLQVYPNPSMGIVTVKANHRGHFRYELLSLVGEKLMEGYANSYVRLNLNGMTGGIYNIRITDAMGHTATQKIILLRR